jgi:hypothetical protein
MRKLGVDSLNSTVEAIINNEKERGNIIAIATYTDRQQVCFLKLGKDQGKDHGEWIPVSALVGVEKLTTSSNEAFIEIPSNNEPTDTKKPQYGLLELATKKAEEDIGFLVIYTTKILQDIKNKASSDIELISKTIKETKQLVEEDRTDKDNFYLAKANQWLNELTLSFGKILNSITNTINSYWNQDWLPILVKELQELADAKLEAAKQEVITLKKENIDYQPYQIAKALIDKKTIVATTRGMITDGLKIVAPSVKTIVNLTVDLTKNVGLLTEMIYQIAIAYGFEKIDDGELLGIIALAFSTEKLRQLGLEILLKQVPFVNLMISISSNIALFQLVGFIACKYYEAKANEEANPLTSNEAYLKLEQQSNAYLTETLSEKETLNQLSLKVVAIRQEVTK